MKTTRSRNIPVIVTLSLLVLCTLGGCSFGVSGSVGADRETGAHIDLDLDFGTYDGAEISGQYRRHQGQTVYVVPDHRASP